MAYLKKILTLVVVSAIIIFVTLYVSCKDETEAKASSKVEVSGMEHDATQDILEEQEKKKMKP